MATWGLRGDPRMDFDLVTDATKWGGAAYGTYGSVVQWSFWNQNFGTEGFAFSGAMTAAMKAEVRAAFAAWSAAGYIDFQEVADSTATANNGLRIGLSSSIDGSVGGQLALTHRKANPNSTIKAAEIA